ncbi:MAG: prolyl oligopeptidase family serine peptidase [Bryobacterales bacterium]|nr:prolyl oligopeptidase family serine peptidase [Bryobacterales bacterium]
MRFAALLILLSTACAQTPQKPMSREILTLPPPPFDHRIAYGSGEFHFGHLRLPKRPGPHPVAIVIHGGFWRAAYDLHYAGHMAASLTQAGFATWNIEYRRIGHEGGGYPGTLDDVAAAAGHLRVIAATHNLDLDHVIAIGHSAGGHLALWLATRKDVLRLQGVISLAGVADLRSAWEKNLGNGVTEELMGGTPEDRALQYLAASPAEQLPLRVPLRLIHGTRDTTVPIAIAEEFARRAKAKGDDAKVIPLDGAGHFELVDPRTQEWQSVLKTALSLVPQLSSGSTR